MTRTKWVSAVALCAALGWSSQADAGWHHRHHGSWGSSGGSWGSSGGSWGSSGGSWGSSGGSWGHHHHRYYGGSWGSSGGSWGSSGGSSGGSWGSSGGSSGGVIIHQSPAQSPMPTETDKPAPPMPEPPADGKTTYRTGSSGTLAVDVPAEAKVFVNGKATTSTGTHRVYASYGLKPGYTYNYQVRVEIVREGQTLSETKHARLAAGRSADLAFDFKATDTQLAGKPAK